ncbi:metalloregulator ArsR/SmtB family transcription factor [Nonomuraea sp. GTA35]|uniref:metalloregulator ArsR/SmtB family transcription factor n=1 Tax=Nonomuraea sp. GTA35 TaxID=1676746 RepID=UPI0035C0EF04
MYEVGRPLLPAAEACSGSAAGPPIPAQLAADLARRLRVLADPARLRLMSILLTHEHGRAGVHELTTAFELAEPTISHHLKVLRDAGLVGHERTGVRSFYWVTSAGQDLFQHLVQLLDDPPGARP